MGSSTVVLTRVLVAVSLYFTVVLIASSNVGVRKTLGKVDPVESAPGLSSGCR